MGKYGYVIIYPSGREEGSECFDTWDEAMHFIEDINMNRWADQGMAQIAEFE